MVPDTSSFHKRTKIHSINEQKIFGANPKLVEFSTKIHEEQCTNTVRENAVSVQKRVHDLYWTRTNVYAHQQICIKIHIAEDLTDYFVMCQTLCVGYYGFEFNTIKYCGVDVKNLFNKNWHQNTVVTGKFSVWLVHQMSHKFKHKDRLKLCIKMANYHIHALSGNFVGDKPSELWSIH